MAEAVVSIVLKELASITRQQIQDVIGVSREVDRLTSSFRAIEAVLVDAEARQVKDASVRLWLDKLKDVSYDAENVLDEWNTFKLKLQIERAENALTLKKKVCSFFLFPCFCFKQVVLHFDIACKLKKINESLDEIAKEKERYSFNIITRGEQSRGVETTSFIDESMICGRDKEKNELMSKLLCESSDEQECLQIISIVGMGGIGKTTLAQLAYNNDEVKNSFEKRIWVCVSNPFDKLRVAKAILEGLKRESSTSTILQTILEEIYQSIIGKKFLLILDDVWTEDYKDWEPLYNCLKNCLNGSKIIVTTRKNPVAIMLKSIVIPIKVLSDNDSWSLFKHFAFHDRSDEECSELELERVGKEIVSKCQGLPLATKTIGSLLRFKRTENEWKLILESEMWVPEKIENDIFAPLLLSYFDLPPMVKKCFLYCATFPKNYELMTDELFTLWNAQGYLKLGRNDKKMIEIFDGCCKSLVAHSLFQGFLVDQLDGLTGCMMHDIVHDFAQFLTNMESFAVYKDFGQLSIDISVKKVENLMLMVNDNSPFPPSICNIKKLRSLLIKFDVGTYSIDGVLLKFLAQNTCLRALALSGTQKFDAITRRTNNYLIVLEKIPKVIGQLIHLRHLDLSNNWGLKMLPETLCELYNLQTLVVSGCNKLEELPQGMEKLINLTDLYNKATDSLKYMPKGFEKLTCLQTLTEFHVSEGGFGSKACSLECLNKFDHLRGNLGIKGLGNLTNVSEAQRIQLAHKEDILYLSLGFDGLGSMNSEAILEALQPPPNLKGLSILEYAGNTVSPNWTESFTHLRRLVLENWIKCEQLPPLGKLQSLESLTIKWMKRVKKVGNELLGLESGDNISSSSVTIFPKLKNLSFYSMEEWEEWDFGIEHQNITIMPNLCSLDILLCPRLKALPKQVLQALKALPKQVLQAPRQVLSIYQCPMLRARYGKGEGEHWSDISHIPYIVIDEEYVKRGSP